jgi:hypothetical protein
MPNTTGGPPPVAPTANARSSTRWCACSVTRPRRVRRRRLRSGCVRCEGTCALTSAPPTSGRAHITALPPSMVSPCSALARSSAAPGYQCVAGACTPPGSAPHQLSVNVAAESAASASLGAPTLYSLQQPRHHRLTLRHLHSSMTALKTSRHTVRCPYAHNCTALVKFPYYLVTVPRAPLTPPPRT